MGMFECFLLTALIEEEKNNHIKKGTCKKLKAEQKLENELQKTLKEIITVLEEYENGKKEQH